MCKEPEDSIRDRIYRLQQTLRAQEAAAFLDVKSALRRSEDTVYRLQQESGEFHFAEFYVGVLVTAVVMGTAALFLLVKCHG